MTDLAFDASDWFIVSFKNRIIITSSEKNHQMILTQDGEFVSDDKKDPLGSPRILSLGSRLRQSIGDGSINGNFVYIPGTDHIKALDLNTWEWVEIRNYETQSYGISVIGQTTLGHSKANKQ